MIHPIQFAAYRRGRWYLVTVPALNTLEKIHIEQMNVAKLPNDLRQYPVDLDRWGRTMAEHFEYGNVMDITLGVVPP